MIVEKDLGGALAVDSRPRGRPIRVNLKRLVFYLVFFLVFCFSGLITILDVIPYRMAMASALVIPLLLIYGIRLDRVLLAHLALVAIVLLSGFWNGSSPTEVLLFLRIPAFSYLMYRLVSVYVRPDNTRRIIRLCVLVAMIQLPFVVLQQLTYEKLPARITRYSDPIDFDFGTFHFKGDAAMAFFLILLVVFLLFDKRHNHIVRRKWIVLSWLTLTVLVSNAKILHLGIAFVWICYLITHMSAKAVVSVIVVFAVVFGALAYYGVFDRQWAALSSTLRSNIALTSRKEEQFLSGGYGRGSAFGYYLRGDLLWLGDGPSAYYDVFTRLRIRGNTGHLLLFYAEVGLLGWLCSVLMFFLIAFPGRKGCLRVSWVGALSFAIIQVLSVTSQIMNNISIVLIYCIVVKSYLIPPKDNRVAPGAKAVTAGPDAMRRV